MKKLIFTCILGSLISGNVFAAIITKHTAVTDLSLAASWGTGSGPVPGSADVVTWSGTTPISLGGTLTLGGGDTSWQGITYSGASTTTVITGTAGQKLTLGNAGVTLSGEQNLSITNSASGAAFRVNVELAANQTWDIATGRTFVVQGQVSGNSTATFDLGGFTLTKTGVGATHLFGSIVSNGTVNVNAGEFRLSAGSGTNANYTNTLTVNVATSATLVVAVNSGSSTLHNQVTNLNGGTLDFQGGNPVSIATVNFGTGTDSLIDFGTGTVAGQLSKIAALSGSGNFSIVDGAGLGTTLTLTGLNSGFTGNVTISTGQALSLSDNAGLKFVIGANGINNRILGGGSATLAGDFTFDLTGAGINSGDSWQIVDNSTLTETYGATFTVVGFTDNLDNTWTSSNGVYRFSEATGTLTVVASIPEPSLVLLSALGFGVLYRRRYV